MSADAEKCLQTSYGMVAVEPHIDMKIEYWETMVRKLASPPRHPFTGQLGSSNIPMLLIGLIFNPEVIIDLKQQIDKYLKVKSSNTIFHMFAPKRENMNQYMPVFYRDVHCKVVLVLFTKYTNVVTDLNTRHGIGKDYTIQSMLSCLLGALGCCGR
jgi:hypothetical protein